MWNGWKIHGLKLQLRFKYIFCYTKLTFIFCSSKIFFIILVRVSLCILNFGLYKIFCSFSIHVKFTFFHFGLYKHELMRTINESARILKLKGLKLKKNTNLQRLKSNKKKTYRNQD